MSGYSLDKILEPIVIKEVISQIALPGTSLSQLFGWNVGKGPKPGAMFADGSADSGYNSQAGNTTESAGRHGSYDIFDHTRDVATARNPAMQSHLVSPQRVGKVNYTVPRIAESMPLLYEHMRNRRKIGGPVGELDRKGKTYIDHQIKFLAQRVANAVEFQTAAMLRGKYYFSNYGDAMHQSFAAPASGDYETIDYQVPAGNLTQLNVTGGGDIVSATWSNANTDIPLQLFNLNAAATEVHGYGIEHIVCSSTVWNYVVNNTKVQAQAGTSNMGWDQLSKTSEGEFTARLRAIPWITWHIVDYGLNVWTPASSARVYTRLVPTTSAIFLPAVNSDWAEYMLGGEDVVEGPNGAESYQTGFYPFAYPTHNPAGRMLNTVHNGFPALKVPKAVMHGTVVF